MKPQGEGLDRYRRARAARRKERGLDERAVERSAEGPGIPADPIAFARDWAWWPHIETRQPVRGLSPIIEDYLARRTAFRWGDDGNRIAGADIVLKPRRVFMTSAILACIAHALILVPRLRALTVVQVGRDDIIRPLTRQLAYMLEHLPPSWTSWRLVGNEVRFGNGSTWEPVTAGSSEQVADKLGRSGALDVLHLSETAFFPHPEALWASLESALPVRTGWRVSESTMPASRQQWHAAEYARTRDGRGRFLRAFFWPWFNDPLKRIRRDDPRYAQAMGDQIAETFRHEVEREDLLGLDVEQRAFRRWAYLLGSPEDRRRARRENPEDDETPYDTPGESWLDAGALEVLAAGCSDPVRRRRLGELYSVSLWVTQADRVVVGVDTALKTGRDRMAAVLLDARGDQIGELHGRALDSEFAAGLAEVLEEIGCGDRRKHIICVERNRGKGLIAELLDRKLRLWRDEGARAGFVTSGASRPLLLDALAGAVEGPGQDEDGSARKPAPVRIVRSAYLAAELSGLEVHDDGKVAAGPGTHDDLPIAYALALRTCGAAKWPSDSVYSPPAVTGVLRGSRHGAILPG